MRWKNLNIGFKLILGFGFFIVLFLIFNLKINSTLTSIDSNRSDVRILNQQSSQIVNDISGYTDQISQALLDYGQDLDMTKFNNALKGLQQDNLLQEQSFLFSNQKINEGVASYVLEMKNNLDKSVNLVDLLILLTSEADNSGFYEIDSSIRLLNETIYSTNSNLLKLFGQLNTFTQEEDGIIQVKYESQFLLIKFGQVILLFVLVLIAFLIIHPFRKAAKQTMLIVRQLADGDLSHTYTDFGNDEFGVIIQSIIELQLKLKSTVKRLKEVTVNLKNASSELSNGAQSISTGANEQASSSTEISSTMDQIAMISKQTTDNANETKVIAQKALKGIQLGAEEVNLALTTIEEIAEKNSMVSEISYQTKILSINASIEAARAAEYGKGFTVIAEHVKRLAENSQESAADIEDVSQRGVRITRDSSQKLQDLVGEFKKTSDLINVVVQSGAEQYQAIEQINNAIRELSNITQHNASSSEELAASSEELVGLSDLLEVEISFFKLTAEELNTQDEDTLDDNEFEDTLDENLLSDSQEQNNEHALSYENGEPIIGDNTLNTHLDKELIREFKTVVDNKVVNPPIENEIERSKNEQMKTHTSKDVLKSKQSSGVRINLADNDEMDRQFKKMK